MNVIFSPLAWSDYIEWQAHDPDLATRLNDLIQDARRSPFVGLGKPEPLRGDLTGWWSRRITKEHRLVYRVEGRGGDQRLEIASCRLHYRR